MHTYKYPRMQYLLGGFIRGDAAIVPRRASWILVKYGRQNEWYPANRTHEGVEGFRGKYAAIKEGMFDKWRSIK